MPNWIEYLPHNPFPPLKASSNPAIQYALLDLKDQPQLPPHSLWEYGPVRKLLSRQQPDGSWKYSGGDESIRSQENYDQLETYRSLGELVEKYAFTVRHPALQLAAEYLFTFQTEDGDFRGIYGNQLTPNYTGGILELLIKAGYSEDPRVEKSFQWLLSIRQQGLGWAIPVQTVGGKLDRKTINGKTLQPDLSKKPSYMVTACVLRAFAAHPRWSLSREAAIAGEYLASRIFQRNEYPGRQSVDFWKKVTFPFWFSDIISVLDTLSRLGFSPQRENIQGGLAWVGRQQTPQGDFDLRILKGAQDSDTPLWINIAACRVFQRFFADAPGRGTGRKTRPIPRN